MKVKELIEKLKAYDPDKEIMILADEFSTYHPEFKLKEIRVQKWYDSTWGEQWYEDDDLGRDFLGDKKIGESMVIIAL